MEEAVYQLLSSTLSPNPTVRINAERELRQQSLTTGFTSTLLHILTVPNVELHIKQSAAIYFKNLVKYWREPVSSDNQRFRLSEADRNHIRANIVVAALSSPPRIRSQLLEAVNLIIQSDYPAEWPELLPKVKSLLESTDASEVHGGLLILLELVKRYEYRAVGNRAELDDITKHAFPLLLHYFGICMQMDTREAGEILRLINKIYFSAMQHEMSPQLIAELPAWVSAFTAFVAKAVPPQEEDANEDPWERAHGPWWRAKKWCYHTLFRLCSRYGNPSLCPTHHRALAKQLLRTTTPVILQAMLGQLNGVFQGQYISPRLVQLTLEFSADCVDHAVTWSILKGNMQGLLVDLCFPLLCFNDADQELWESDPHEYLRSKFDVEEEYRSPVAAAMNFVNKMVTMRTKSTLMIVLQFCHTVLATYAAAPVEQRNYRQKDGALAMIGAAATTIEESAWLIPQIEELIQTHVLCEMECPAPFIRARALWLLCRFGSVDFNQEQTVARALEFVVRGMRDKELPVRVEAALALSSMLARPLFQEHVKPSLHLIMQELMSLTQETSVDSITDVMSTLAEMFADDMAPFAVQLCTQMRDTFLGMFEESMSKLGAPPDLSQLAAAMDDDDDDDDNGMLGMTIMGVLRTMLTIIRAVDEQPKVLAELEPVFYPLISAVLQQSNIDFMEEIIEMVASFTDTNGERPISELMWSVLPMLYHSYSTAAFDYFTEMVPAIDNFISSDTANFMADPSRLQMVLTMIEGVMTSTRAGDMERANACKLIEILIIRLPGRIDSILPTLINWALDAAGRAEEDALIVCGLEVPINALYYSPAVTLGHLEAKGWTGTFLQAWAANIGQFYRVHDKKMAILVLCLLWRLDAEHMPAALKQNLGNTVKMMAALLESLPEAMERRQAAERYMLEGREEEEESGDVEDSDIEDGDDVFNEADAKYLENLTRRAGKAARRTNAIPEDLVDEDEADEDDEDDDDEEEDEEDDGLPNYPSGLEEEFFIRRPTDEVDEFNIFKETMEGLQAAGADGRWAAISSAITPEFMQIFTKAAATAQKNKEAAAAASQA